MCGREQVELIGIDKEKNPLKRGYVKRFFSLVPSLGESMGREEQIGLPM